MHTGQGACRAWNAPFAPDAADAALNALAKLIAACDTCALTLYQSQAAALGPDYAELDRQLKQYDFEDATATLKRARVG